MTTIIIFFLISVSLYLFMQLPMFGKIPSGKRLEKIKTSPNYRNGSFQNLSKTPDLTDGATFFSVMIKFIFGQSKRVEPVDTIPSMKTDLLNLDIDKDVLVWFGHSSYFIQIDNKRILVDPVFCGHASPFSFSTKAFIGSNIYGTEDVPEIDILFITHDHWDHLDYKTTQELKPKIKKVICGLGIGEHLEHWGYSAEIIIEKDWNEQIEIEGGFVINTVPARHFSGRGFKRNQTLWTSFVLRTPSMKLFIGGDSGYDNHFKEIGKTFGDFDLVILENGQYDKSWKYIHLMPSEIIYAAKDLNAKKLFAIHNSKFALANHEWDEPLIITSEQSEKEDVNLITPMIGEQINLKDDNQKFSRWWEGIN